MMLHSLGFSLILLLAPAWVLEEHVEPFSNDGLFLLQMSKREHRADAHIPPTMPQQVTISPHSGAMKFVGRHDVVRFGDEDIVRFDAAGFEVQFRVQGASEVKASISQQINGPGGWYATDDPSPEDVFEDACFVSKKTVGLSEGSVDEKTVSGMLTQGSQPHHFLVYVDGVPQLKPLMKSRCSVCTFDTTEAVSGQAREYTLARGLDRSKSHHIRIVKTSEPDFSSDPAPVPNWLALHSLILDQGFAQRPDPPRNRKIEFLGDSLMSGYCNTCKGTVCHGGQSDGSNMGGEPPDTYRWGSFALAWPHLVCEELQAECHTTVLSGMGIHCNTHPPGPFDCSADQTLPHYWHRTLASDMETKWDFSTWTPDVLVIQASGNDHLDDPDRDKAAVLATYDKFLDTVHEKYPNAHVVLVCGPFHPWRKSEKALAICPAIEELVHKRKDRGSQIHVLTLSSFPGNADLKECCAHPDEDFHKLIKVKAVEEVKWVMGWSDAP